MRIEFLEMGASRYGRDGGTGIVGETDGVFMMESSRIFSSFCFIVSLLCEVPCELGVGNLRDMETALDIRWS